MHTCLRACAYLHRLPTPHALRVRAGVVGAQSDLDPGVCKGVCVRAWHPAYSVECLHDGTVHIRPNLSLALIGWTEAVAHACNLPHEVRPIETQHHLVGRIHPHAVCDRHSVNMPLVVSHHRGAHREHEQHSGVESLRLEGGLLGLLGPSQPPISERSHR